MEIQKNKDGGSIRRNRMTAKRNPEAGKRVNRGEPIEMVARSIDVTAAEVSRRRDKAKGGFRGFEKQWVRKAKDLEIESLCSKMGEIT